MRITLTKAQRIVRADIYRALNEQIASGPFALPFPQAAEKIINIFRHCGGDVWLSLDNDIGECCAHELQNNVGSVVRSVRNSSEFGRRLNDAINEPRVKIKVRRAQTSRSKRAARRVVV